MTLLRRRMEAELRLRNLAPGTACECLRRVAVFARYFWKSAASLGTWEVRAFLLNQAEFGRAPATQVVYHVALRFLCIETRGRPEVMATAPRPRVRSRPSRRPLTRDEVAELLAQAVSDPFTYTLVATLLATGLRISECCTRRVEAIDSRTGFIHVCRGRGAKPRSVKLGGRHLALLRRYWEVGRPGGPWLFRDQRLSSPGVVDARRRYAGSRIVPTLGVWCREPGRQRCLVSA